MGLFSGISKAFKSIFKGVGKVFKSVGKAVKSFVGSKWGKIALIAAAIWVGGLAIGAWGGGTAASAAATEAAAAGAGATASTSMSAAATGGLSTAGAEAAGAAAAAAPVTAAVAPAAAGGTGLVAGGGTGLTAAGGLGLTAPAAALTPTFAPTGFMSSLGGAVTGAAKWMAANPIPTLVGGQMLAGAFSPNALDAAEQENNFRIAEEGRRQQEINDANARIAKLGGMQTWGYSGTPLQTSPVIPQTGIMGRRLVL